MFDQESEWTMDDWLNSQARYIMSCCPYTYSDFVLKADMTPEEIEKHPECETIGGYVKVFRITDEDKQKWWDGLDGEDKTSVMSLPNFDKDKFYKCTGIKIKEGEKMMNETIKREMAEPTETKLLTDDSVNVPLGAVVIPLSEYKELIQSNAQMECLLDDILAYVDKEAYIRRDTILEMMGVNADE